MPDVSIIIVNYNTKDLLFNCLDSLYKNTSGIEFEVLVSDNGSDDGSIEMLETDFPNIILINNKENLGFGAANNRALDIAKGKYIFYLNSDTILLNNAVKFFFDYWESHNDVKLGALGGFLLNADCSPGHSGGFFPSYFHYFLSVWSCVARQLGLRKKINLKLTQNPNVDYVIGADLFLLNNKYARFDERFFMYSEEVDLQYQLAKAGFERKLIYGPEIIHLGGGSEKKSIHYDFKKITRFYYWSSLLKYFKKNDYKRIPYFILKNSIHAAFLLPWNFKETKNYRRELKRI